MYFFDYKTRIFLILLAIFLSFCKLFFYRIEHSSALGIPDTCHKTHNRWLCKQIQSSVKFSNWYAKETAFILHAQNV